MDEEMCSRCVFSTTPLGEDWRHAGEHGHRSRSHFSNWVLKHPLTASRVVQCLKNYGKNNQAWKIDYFGFDLRKIIVNSKWLTFVGSNRFFL